MSNTSNEELRLAKVRLSEKIEAIPYVMPSSVATEDRPYAEFSKGVTGVGVGVSEKTENNEGATALRVNCMTPEDAERIRASIGETFEGHEVVYDVTGVIRAL